jgi:hypothetical protein
MKNKLQSFVFVLALILGTQVDFAIGATQLLTNRPSNFDDFKNKINTSLVGFTCSGNESIGFSANWAISEDTKNTGVNSFIFTSNNSLMSCGGHQSTFKFEYKNKTYDGKTWNRGTSLPDFGNFTTSVLIPKLPMYNNTPPTIDSWVGVVRYTPGFGFLWSESKVRAYNPETLIFAIDPIVPLIEKNALVFNSQGDFIGIVSKIGVQPVAGLTLVHGAALQCQFNQTQSSPTLSQCGDGNYAQNVWSETSPKYLAKVKFLNSFKENVAAYEALNTKLKKLVPKARLTKSTRASYLKTISNNEIELKKFPSYLANLQAMGTGEEYVTEVNLLVEKMNALNSGLQIIVAAVNK